MVCLCFRVEGGRDPAFLLATSFRMALFESVGMFEDLLGSFHLALFSVLVFYGYLVC